MKNLSMEEKNDLENCVFVPLKKSKESPILSFFEAILLKLKNFFTLKYKD